jgi:integrase/recombinase XerD
LKKEKPIFLWEDSTMINTFTSRYRDFSKENKIAIRDFLIHYASRGVKPSSVGTAEDNLVTMFKNIGPKKSYRKITNRDIDYALQKSGWIPSAQETLKRTMKQFLVYHKRKKIADGIILNAKACKVQKPHDSALTPDEIEKLLNCYNEPMNSAVIETFINTGGRLGETHSMNVVSVRFEDEIIWYDVRDSKTKIRSIPLIPNSKNPVAIYPKKLLAWLSVHPLRNDKDAPLFLSRSNEVKYYNKRMSKQGIQRLVRRAKKLTGIKKQLSPKTFRHTSATYDGEILNEQMLCTKYGWEIGSPMPRVYCHVNQNNLVKQLREHAGIKPGETPQEKICPRCGERNNPNAEQCTRCSMILEPKKLMEELDKRKNLEQKIREEFTEKFEKLKSLIMNQQDIIDDLVKKDLERNYSEFKHYQFPRDNKTGKEIPFKTFRKKQTS